MYARKKSFDIVIAHFLVGEILHGGSVSPFSQIKTNKKIGKRGLNEARPPLAIQQQYESAKERKEFPKKSDSPEKKGRREERFGRSFKLFTFFPFVPGEKRGKGKIETWVGILDTRAVPQKKRKLSNFKI